MSKLKLIFVAKLYDMLEYFTLKSIKKLNFRAKNLDFDAKSKKLGLTNQIHTFFLKLNFWTKNGF